MTLKIWFWQRVELFAMWLDRIARRLGIAAARRLYPVLHTDQWDFITLDPTRPLVINPHPPKAGVYIVNDEEKL